MRFAPALLLLTAASAQALPTGPRGFCANYPDAAECQGSLISCSECHAGPPVLNDYGNAVISGFYMVDENFTLERYDELLPQALALVEGDDSDLDGATNLEEIMLGTLPGNDVSTPVSIAVTGELPNDFYDVGNYDPKFAFKRASLAICGRSPTYEEMEAFKSASDQRLAIHEVVANCLNGDAWRNDVLHRMADKRIRPLRAVGREGEIVLADYEWDYRLFSYVMSGDRDVRDLLRAQYHVGPNDEVIDGTIPKSNNTPNVIFKLGSGQPLAPQLRAGMITTQWFLMINTMFTALPRTTAAQAYRSYLGQDISKGQGIMPVQGEPRDLDNKGVTQISCAACHSTLDPLAYSFGNYEGIVISIFGNRNGNYNAFRSEFSADGTILGERVDGVVHVGPLGVVE
jgi:hypothetical protein